MQMQESRSRGKSGREIDGET